jgi:hypothetical protein
MAVGARCTVADARTSGAVPARLAGGFAHGWPGTARRAEAGPVDGITAQFCKKCKQFFIQKMKECILYCNYVRKLKALYASRKFKRAFSI